MAAPATTAGLFYGVLSDAALSNVALTNAQLNEMSATPPPVSTRDLGWHRDAAIVRLSTKSERQEEFPTLRPLAEGAANQRLTQGLAGVTGQRLAFRIGSCEVGRPFAVDRLRAQCEVLEGIAKGSKPVIDTPAFGGGIDRSRQPTQVGARQWDVRNATFQGNRFRSRRGFAVINNASDDVEGKPSAFYDATDAAGDTWHLVLIGGTLYTIDNGELIEIDTGWPEDELPTVATVGLKTFIASRARVRMFSQGSIFTPGVAAPTDKPIFVSSTPNVTGGVVALHPGYEYVYCFYDGTRLTESGPSGVTKVVLPPGSTASSLAFSLGVSASTTVSARRLYRRKVGTDAWFLVATISDNTTTSVTDSREIPPDINATLDSPQGFFVTAEFPDGTSVATVEGRLLVYRLDDTRVVAISEVGDGERWFPFNRVTHDGDVRSIVTHEGRAIVLTDRTLEVIEGDWVRGSAGTLGVQRRVLDKSRGCFGPFAATSARGRLWWADPAGIHALGEGLLLKDTADTISDEVQDIVASAVDTAGSNVVLEYNHVSSELWVLLSQATGDATDPKNRIVLTINLKNGAWAILDHSLSFIRRVFDGLLGPRLVGCDYFGTLLEMDVYDGDGIQGDESWLPADPAITAFDEDALTVTIDGASFPGTLRGVSIVLENVDATDASEQFFRTTILADSGDTLTLAAFPPWALTAFVPEDPGPPVVPAIPGDKARIGAIYSYLDTKEHDAGSPGRKKVTETEVSFADCTRGRF